MNSEAVTDFADFLRDQDVADLRVALHYEGDEYEPVFVREDVGEQFTDEQFDEIAKQFVLKSLDDWTEQPEFTPYGHLDIVTRWFHEVVFVQIPTEEWAGILVSFDRDSIADTGDLIDAILDYVDDPAHGLRSPELEDEDEALAAAEEHFGG